MVARRSKEDEGCKVRKSRWAWGPSARSSLDLSQNRSSATTCPHNRDNPCCTLSLNDDVSPVPAGFRACRARDQVVGRRRAPGVCPDSLLTQWMDGTPDRQGGPWHESPLGHAADDVAGRPDAPDPLGAGTSNPAYLGLSVRARESSGAGWRE